MRTKLLVSTLAVGFALLSAPAMAIGPGENANPDNQSINCEEAGVPDADPKNLGQALKYNRENDIHNTYKNQGQFVKADTQDTGGSVVGTRSATIANFHSKCDQGPPPG